MYFIVVISDLFLFLKGKPTAASQETEVLKYGEVEARSYVPGTEGLPEEKLQEEEKGKKGDGN